MDQKREGWSEEESELKPLPRVFDVPSNSLSYYLQNTNLDFKFYDMKKLNFLKITAL